MSEHILVISVRQFLLADCHLICSTEMKHEVTYTSVSISLSSLFGSQSGSVVLILLCTSPNPMN